MRAATEQCENYVRTPGTKNSAGAVENCGVDFALGKLAPIKQKKDAACSNVCAGTSGSGGVCEADIGFDEFQRRVEEL